MTEEGIKYTSGMQYNSNPPKTARFAIDIDGTSALQCTELQNLPLATGSVTTENLADGSVTLSKLSSEAKPQRTSTLVIAASDASAKSKSGADYVCTGVNDQEVIRTAISSISGQKIYLRLTEGVFWFDSDLYYENPALDLQIQGSGQGITTIIATDAFANGRHYPMLYFLTANCKVSDMTIDGRDVIIASANKTVRGLWIYGGGSETFVENMTFKSLSQALITRGHSVIVGDALNNTFIRSCAFRNIKDAAIITENNNGDWMSNFFISDIFIDMGDTGGRSISLWSDYAGRESVYINNVNSNSKILAEPKVKAFITNSSFSTIELLANSGCVIAHNSCDDIINNGPSTDTPNIIYGNYITSDNIADGAVTGEKLANGAVTQDKIGAYAVTADKINNDAVTESKILGGSVTRYKLANGAVTPEKLLYGYPVINVDRFFPLSSGHYTITTAVAAIPDSMRTQGLIITWHGSRWFRYQFIDADLSNWNQTSCWENLTPAQADPLQRPDYSSEEQWTGLKWVNGKMIFQKTVYRNVGDLSIPAGSGALLANVFGGNIEEIIRTEWSGITSGNFITGSPSYVDMTSGGWSLTLFYAAETDSLQYRKTTAATITNLTMTLFYTKGDETTTTTTTEEPADGPPTNPVATVRIDVSKLAGIASVSGEGMYEEGSTCTVSCVVEDGYIFDGWYDTTGGAYTKVSGSMTWSFAVMDDRSLVARANPEPETPEEPSTEEPTDEPGAGSSEIELSAESLTFNAAGS